MRRLRWVPPMLVASETTYVPGECCPPTTGTAQTKARRVLMGVVTSTKNRRIVDNIEALAFYDVSWLVALYDGSGIPEAEAYAKGRDIQFDVFDGRRPGQTCPFCPKLQFHLLMATKISGFDYVWLPDDDISFVGFQWTNFWLAHSKAGDPVVSQPLIRPMTQYNRFFVNARQWRNCNSSYVLTNFIEMQAPVLDGAFFSYFFPHLGVLAQIQDRFHSSWGPDVLWCKAAAAFQPHRERCALILANGGVEVHHLDLKTTVKTQTYQESGAKIRHLLASAHHDPLLRQKLNLSAFLNHSHHFHHRFNHRLDTLDAVKSCVQNLQGDSPGSSSSGGG